MKVTVTARHAKFTDAVKDSARTKAGRLEHFFDHLKKIEVILDLDGDTKYSAEMIASGLHDDIIEAIVQREKIGSTGIGGGVGVPHAKLDGIKNVIGAFGRCSPPIEFSAVDGAPVDLVFLILSPPSKGEAYLKALQKVMTALKRPNFVRFLKGAKTVREIEEIFREVEEVAV